ncbi:MAG: T9SS type A sorting domain-containing protein [Bacteroidales bacterium]|nr:T9SS type A sorting domain-containing protein [Bacteroidales bacterium]
MKKVVLFLFVLSLSFSFSLNAQNGWRTDEKEVKVKIENQSQAQKLHDLRFNGDFYNDHAILYVVPVEYDRLVNSGFKCEILIDDLNKHYQNFWNNKDAYHTYQEIIDLMDSLVTAFPSICTKTIYGTSVEGRELSALKISDNVATDENEAEVFFDGGIHGDEVGAAENCIRFARMLCLEYGNDPTITDLIDTREIWIYPMVNPDGRVNNSRYNSNGVDLNRDWGYMWDGWGNSTGAYSQIESKALRACMSENQFVVHTTYHSGTEYVSYPWSYRANWAPDKAHIDYLAGIYSSTSGYSSLNYGQGCTGMYPINGSTKDSNYGIMGSISWSMEISYNKHPPTSQIMMYYNYNEPSMIAMIEYSGYGLQGTITDANTGDTVQAIVYVEDYFQTYNDPVIGDYHKYVLPGTYSITVSANGYETQTINNVVVTDNTSVTTTDFQLQPDSGNFAYRIVSSRIPNNNTADEGNTQAVFGDPDDINYSIGKNGWVVIDMQEPIVDGEGNDLIVYEGDDSEEGYTCYASLTKDGPWVFLGDGSGTTEFDFSTAWINNAQYIKIKDDGDGVANVNNAGFDLDAIKAIEHSSGVYISLIDYTVIDTAANGNGWIDPGETVDLEVILLNTGDNVATVVEGTISAGPLYVTIIEPYVNFGNIYQNDSASGIFTFSISSSTPLGQTIIIELDVTSNNGNYTNNYEMEFVIGEIPVLIIDLDGNNNSGTEIQNICENMDVVHQYVTSVPEEMERYNSAFVCLGIYNDNHALSSNEGDLLADYLNNGGNIYMEGGDTWFYDDPTAVHPMFNINGLDDGSGNLNTLQGISNTFVHDLEFNYSGDNNYIDQIESVSPAFVLFNNNSPEYFCVVAHDAGDYKTIGSSFEFGGLDNGTPPSTKEEYFQRILDFFNGIYSVIPEDNNIAFAESVNCVPNPFSNQTSINFNLQKETKVSLDIFDIDGRNVKTLINSKLNSGKHNVIWNGSDNSGNTVAEGIYFYRIKTISNSITKKLLFLQ